MISEIFAHFFYPNSNCLSEINLFVYLAHTIKLINELMYLSDIVIKAIMILLN